MPEARAFRRYLSCCRKFADELDILLDVGSQHVLYMFGNLKAVCGKFYNPGQQMSASDRIDPRDCRSKSLVSMDSLRSVMTLTSGGPGGVGIVEPADVEQASSGEESFRASVRGLSPNRATRPEGWSLAQSLIAAAEEKQFSTILADPPWRFANRTGKMAPEHRRLARYATLTIDEIRALPVLEIAAATAHLYLWVPNALLPWGLSVVEAWGFEYKSNIIWHKVRKDGGSDGRGVGFYFRNVTEMLLFGVRGRNARTLAPGRRQVNYLSSKKREHSRKPDEQYDIIEACSPGPYIELFARGARTNWTSWGNQADDSYKPNWATYSYNSSAGQKSAAD